MGLDLRGQTTEALENWYSVRRGIPDEWAIIMFGQETEWSEIVGWSVPPNGFSESERLLSSFFAASNVGFSIIDSQFIYQAINRTLAQMNGFAPEAHLGKSMRDILGNAAGLIEPILHQVLLTGKPVTNVALTLRLPTRKELGHWVVHYFPMNSVKGKVTRIGVVVVEVTEQKRLENMLGSQASQLERVEECRGALLEVSTALNSTHDLRRAFPGISASVRKIAAHDWADLSMLEESTFSMRTYVADCRLDPRLAEAGVSIAVKDAIAGGAAAERHPKTLNRTELAAIPSQLVSQLLERGIQSACCVPFVTPNGVIGSFNLASTKGDAFHTEKLDWLKQITLQLANALDHCLDNAPLHRSWETENRIGDQSLKVRAETKVELDFEEIVGESKALRRVLDQAKTVARSDATVLILGDTGTGKDLIARAIHHMSLRRNAPFIKLNCAAIPAGLLESELFGHEKGAFTGAVTQKAGRVEMADRGTLFLDEIGDLPLDLQPKLLRVLQEQEFERLGGNRTVRVNIRLLAATNRDLSASLTRREFRADLYYRLNVFPIRVPALGERVQDIPLLVRHFAQKYARKMNKKIDTISGEALKALEEWSWPGNVRELENFIERSVILSDGSVLNVPLDQLQSRATQPSVTLDSMGREYIIRALRESHGAVRGPEGAAMRLGLQTATFYAMMRRLKIPCTENHD